MRSSEVFAELLRIRVIRQFLPNVCVFAEVYEFLVHIANTQNWGSFSATSAEVLPHLGHVANAFGSCGKRIWVMLQTHLGHVANAFGSCGRC